MNVGRTASLEQVHETIHAALTVSARVERVEDASLRKPSGQLEQIVFLVRAAQGLGDHEVRVLWDAATKELFVEALIVLPQQPDPLLLHSLANAVNARRSRAYVFLMSGAPGAFAFARGSLEEIDVLVSAVQKAATHLYDTAAARREYVTDAERLL